MLVCVAVALIVGVAAPAKAGIRNEVAPATACPNQSAQATPAAQVDALRCLIGWARRRHGLRPVRVSSRLDRAARLRAADIRRCGDFSHTACGAPFGRVFSAAGYMRPGASVGENLAWGSGPLGSPRATVRGWLTSPGHRAILLGRRWREGGVGLVRAPSLFGQTNVEVWVAQFGRR